MIRARSCRRTRRCRNCLTRGPTPAQDRRGRGGCTCRLVIRAPSMRLAPELYAEREKYASDDGGADTAHGPSSPPRPSSLKCVVADRSCRAGPFLAERDAWSFSGVHRGRRLVTRGRSIVLRPDAPADADFEQRRPARASSKPGRHASPADDVNARGSPVGRFARLVLERLFTLACQLPWRCRAGCRPDVDGAFEPEEP
jgi:hypothetical protein